jgi:hypothetical protein
MYRARLAKGVTLTKVEGKHVLFSLKTGDTFGLNDTAAFMLAELLRADSDKAVSETAKEYMAAASELETDLGELTRDLETLKLIEIVR